MSENSNHQFVKYKDSHEIYIAVLGKQVLGGHDAMQFSSQIHALIEEKIKLVIIDLGYVEIMNSSGLGMLVAALGTTKKSDILLHLASVPDKVMTLLKMTHLNEVFKIFESVDSAAKI
ncbi:MAG: Anti-anti-sigma regulatory factor [Ignavibacteria bacterium]|nr:Anti-anti-sigma regulatory factor [Ignavibacteria bacterium]